MAWSVFAAVCILVEGLTSRYSRRASFAHSTKRLMFFAKALLLVHSSG